METSLHRQLKRHYAGAEGQIEVPLGRYRVDAIANRRGRPELIEIQHGPLSAIRDKILHLLAEHRVRVVKPIVRRKRLVKRSRKAGRIIDRRQSPLRGDWRELLSELLYFTRVFPHANLTLEAVLVDIEEWRYPRPLHARSRRPHMVEDQKLVAIGDAVVLRSAADLRQLVSCVLPQPFHTADLAAAMEVPRWQAQQIAYVLRKAGTIAAVGKQRGAWLYEWTTTESARRAA